MFAVELMQLWQELCWISRTYAVLGRVTALLCHLNSQLWQGSVQITPAYTFMTLFVLSKDFESTKLKLFPFCFIQHDTGERNSSKDSDTKRRQYPNHLQHNLNWQCNRKQHNLNCMTVQSKANRQCLWRCRCHCHCTHLCPLDTLDTYLQRHHSSISGCLCQRSCLDVTVQP